MKIVLTPDWFLGFDVLIEVFSFIVLAIFSALSIQSYRLNKEKRNFLYLGMGFVLIAFAQLATILTKVVLYYDFDVIQEIGNAIITSNLISSVDIFYYIGFFFYRFLMLAGLYVIYRLNYEKTSLEDYFLFAYFIFLSAILSTGIYYLYYLTTLILLLLIMRNYHRIYKENHFFNTKLLLVAFGILAFSQLLFIFPNEIPQAAGNIAELISYVTFLFIAVKIWNDGKKKKPHGDNIRHAGYNTPKKREH
jgi:hypothetical protein